MELSRQEYPALLTSLSPNQAVTVLNDRVTLIGKINHDIAEWLAERRRIEDIYAQSLRKLSQRRQHGAEGLGVFQTPWQSIVASCETLADSHDNFARRIEVDVEQPLREYQSKNREMQGINNVKGNLASVAKDFDEAQKKADKLQAKGAKADSSRLSSALSGVQEVSQLWESQAPFVFEQLQALDESRVNHLRDALTQLQTHEVDTLERSRVTAASSLEAILNISTADEISSFVAQSSEAAPSLASPRRQSRPGTSNATPATPSVPPVPPTPDTAATLMPPPPTPSMDDRRSEVSSTSGSRRGPPPPTPERKKSGFGGLRRLGTVMSRRKDKEASSPKPEKPVQERKTKGSRNPLRRNSTARDMQPIPSPNASMTELADTSSRQAPRTPDPQESHPLSRSVSTDPEPAQPTTNGESAQPKPSEPSAMTNGNITPGLAVPERKTRPPSTILEEGAGGSAVDEIDRAQQEAAATENDAPQFKLNIRNEPIQEENSDAQKAALNNMANTLRAQAVPTPRKQGTIRGRRDVRNTIFVPNPTTTDSLSAIPGLPTSETTNLPASPFMLQRSSTEERGGADTQSVRSGHSLSSLGTAVPKHPEMLQPGLNASVIETVSSSFHDGEVTKAMVVGELALVHNGEKADPTADVIRLENFPVLYKVAPNPLFVNQVPDKSGEYTIDISQLSRTQVAFKYQVHLEDNALSAYSPVVLRPNWKIESTQISVILSYAFNHSLLSEKTSITLQNVVLIINIEGAKAVSCQSKPVGTFSKERNMIYWKLGEVSLEKFAENTPRLLARFTTESEAKPGNIEARWEVSGEQAVGLGSGLGISQASAQKEEGAGGSDPFADEGTAAGSLAGYKEVTTARKLTSGTYAAN